MRTAIRDTSRPIPENNAIGTSASADGADAPSGAAMGSFRHLRLSNSLGVSNPLPCGESSHPGQRFSLIREFREIPPQDDKTGQRNWHERFRQVTLTGFTIFASARVYPR